MIDPSFFAALLAGHPERALAVATVDGGSVWSEVLGEPESRPFAIGSISKLFTALVLSDSCERGELTLDTRLDELLADVAAANPTIAAITLGQLASHTAGLPRESAILIDRYNAGRVRDEDPYVDFVAQDLLESLSTTQAASLRGPTQTSGSRRWRTRLSSPQIAATGNSFAIACAIPSAFGRRSGTREGEADTLAAGHDAAGLRAPRWREVLPGPGGIWSTADDLAALLGAASSPSPLSAAVARTMRPVAMVGGGRAIGLGWHVDTSSATTWYWHSGGSGGFHSFLALDRDRGRGLVALANWADDRASAEQTARAALGMPR